jgi:hypothetical protein
MTNVNLGSYMSPLNPALETILLIVIFLLGSHVTFLFEILRRTRK